MKKKTQEMKMNDTEEYKGKNMESRGKGRMKILKRIGTSAISRLLGNNWERVCLQQQKSYCSFRYSDLIELTVNEPDPQNIEPQFQ